MSEFDWCSICGQFGLVARHRCPPAWEVVIAEDDDWYPGEDDPKVIYANGADSAAEKWAAWWDGGCTEDYALAGGEQVTVIVTRAAHPEQTSRLVVTGEMVPEYRAHEG